MTKSFDSRRNNIDAIRLILALLVLFSHSFPAATNQEEDEPLILATIRQMTLGGLAVNWFFVLSGYLISQSWERSRTTWSFFIKRVARIYPGYLVAIAFCLWVVVPIGSPDGWQVFSFAAIKANIRRVMMLRGLENIPPTFVDVPMPNTVNASLWTISYEFWCYMLVLGFGALLLLRRRWLLLALLLGSVALDFLVVSRDSPKLYDLSPRWRPFVVVFGQPRFWTRLLPCFLAGMVGYQFRTVLLPPRRLWATLCLVVLAISARFPDWFTVTLPLFGSYLLLYLAFTQDFRWHGAARYGDFSYGIYLYAFPIQQLIMFRIGHPVSPYLLFALALVPTVLAGVMSWHLVERRFLQRAHRSDQPALAAAAAPEGEAAR